MDKTDLIDKAIAAAEQQIGFAEQAMLGAPDDDPGELERLRHELRSARQARDDLQRLRSENLPMGSSRTKAGASSR
jgi:hypothetical protein